MKRLTVVSEENSEVSLADARCAFQYGPKHRLQFARRRTDHAQHFGRSGKLFQSLVALAGELYRLGFSVGSRSIAAALRYSVARFGFCALRRRALADSLVALERRRNASP